MLLILSLNNADGNDGIAQYIFIAHLTLCATSHGIDQVNIGCLPPALGQVCSVVAVSDISLHCPQQHMASTSRELNHPLVLVLQRAGRIVGGVRCISHQSHTARVGAVYIHSQNRHTSSGPAGNTQLTVSIAAKTIDFLGPGGIVINGKNHAEPSCSSVHVFSICIGTTSSQCHSALEELTLTIHSTIGSLVLEVGGTAGNVILAPDHLHGYIDEALVRNILSPLTNT